MPKVNSRRHELGQMVPELRLPGSHHGQQGHELKAEEEAVQNPNPALESRFAQQAIRREPPDEIQQQKEGMMADMIDMAGDTLVPGGHTFQRVHLGMRRCRASCLHVARGRITCCPSRPARGTPQLEIARRPGWRPYGLPTASDPSAVRHAFYS